MKFNKQMTYSIYFLVMYSLHPPLFDSFWVPITHGKLLVSNPYIMFTLAVIVPPNPDTICFWVYYL